MKRRWRIRDTLFNDEDAAVLTAALKSRFPRIRIVADECWYKQREDDDPERVRSLVVPYQETLSGPYRPNNATQLIWLEPENWRPIWGPFERIHRIENPPRLQFTWWPSYFHFSSWTGFPGQFALGQGRVTAHVLEGDKEHTAFVNSVWRMIAGVSTNKTYWCYHDLKAGEIRGPYNANNIWIGHKALDWVRSDRRFCFFHRHRPVDAIEGFTQA